MGCAPSQEHLIHPAQFDQSLRELRHATERNEEMEQQLLRL